MGGSKLAWNSKDLHFVYASFPTLYVAFASHGNQSEGFSLGVTSQVNPQIADIYIGVSFHI